MSMFPTDRDLAASYKKLLFITLKPSYNAKLIEMRTKWHIPIEDGIQTGSALLAWRREFQTYEWNQEINELTQYFKKSERWRFHFESHILTNFISGPLGVYAKDQIDTEWNTYLFD